MSLGINVLMMLSKRAAQVLGDGFDIEIIEQHHNQKLDAPSGTALMIADGIKNVLDADDITVNNKSEKKRVVNGKEQTFVVYNTDKGVAIQSTDPNAFSGNLTILVGFDTEGTIKGYTLLAHAETPGLGAKAADWFQKGQPGSIVGLNPAETNLTVKNDGGEVSAITASTITSRAFLRAVQQAYLTFMEEKGK